MSKRRKHRTKLHSVYVWHRYLGVSAALFVVLLSTTGLLLNHSDDLDLGRRFVSSPVLLSWYGIEAPDKTVSFAAGSHLLTLMGTRVYDQDSPLAGEYKTMLGAVASADMLVVAADASLLLLTAEGELIERIDAVDGLPQGMAAIGLDSQGRPVVKAAQGIYQPDSDWLQWSQRKDVRDITWAKPQRTPADLRLRIQRQYLGKGLSIERVLLDLHSGRIFRHAGRGLNDAVAILLIVLSITGVWAWIRHRR